MHRSESSCIMRLMSLHESDYSDVTNELYEDDTDTKMTVPDYRYGLYHALILMMMILI